MKLYSAYYDEKDPFGIFAEVVPVASAKQLQENDGVLVLWGGADISPAIYNQTRNSFTFAGDKLSPRDRFEVACAHRAMELGMPIVGICRGAQLMCCLSGGSLIQHVDNHCGGDHQIQTFDGKKLETNSIHHQMMNLKGTKHELRAFCSPALASMYMGEYDIPLDIDVEPEIVYFPETRCLAIQGHPEYLHPAHPFVMHCVEEMKCTSII